MVGVNVERRRSWRNKPNIETIFRLDSFPKALNEI
jgi:hypothetical protein